MKLQELGLKSKPQTKYFEGGFISFYTSEKELFFEVVRVSPDRIDRLYQESVTSKKQLDELLAVKTLSEAVCA